LLMAALRTGPKRWGELKTALSAGGLSESSLNSALSKWQKEGGIVRSGHGLWSLVGNGEAQAANAG
jgi:DNA-binding HxlR family transcriptional regulator